VLLAPELAPDLAGPFGTPGLARPRKTRTPELSALAGRAGTPTSALANRRLQPLGHPSTNEWVDAGYTRAVLKSGSH